MEIEKCGWCRKEPKIWGVHAGCQTPECIGNNDVEYPLEEWDATQRRILAARKKDFEAGKAETTVDNGPGYRTVAKYATFEDYISKEGE